ncbi:MAG: ATP-binding protein [Candidatus Tritonobacter lacicola]|nr:ATP-binding protein [Candidatus Tritonobacter lacicola]
MERDTLTKTIELPATVDNLESLCSFARKVCGSASTLALSEEQLYKIELAVSEAVTNVIKYAYPGAEVGTVVLELALDDDGVTIKVKDQGVGFDFEKAGEPPRDGVARESGLGIYIIRSVSESVRYRDEGPLHVLTMRFGVA